MEILKHIQMKKREYEGIKEFLITQAGVIDLGYLPMRPLRTQFLEKFPYFTDEYAKAIVNTKPFTVQKTFDKHAAANIFGPLAETGWAFADQIADLTLKGQMDWTKAKIFNSTDENMPSICQNIYKNLKDKLPNTILTGTYLIDLTLLDEDLVFKTTYVDSSNACHIATSGKSVGRHNISNTSIPELDAILVNIEKIISHMSPDFQSQYDLLYRVTTSPGVRHDHLFGMIFNSITNAGIDGVKILLVEHPEHFAMSNLLFEYELNTFPSGTWQFQVSKVGYHTITVTITIGRGLSVHHDFMLVPITPPIV